MKENREVVPLRTILQNCLNHIENLEANRAVCDNYEREFQDLKQFSETLKTQKEFLCTEGEKEVNKKKNRYKDILPFNVSRVTLTEYAGIPGSDYINANYIKGASGSPAYIASQGPLPNTVNDFWRMVVECEVQVIVMACNAEEAGKHKCENYWVEKEGEEKRFGMVEICLVKASIICPDFLVRTMKLKYTNNKAVTEERTICQFHYSAWPDHGVPPLVRPLLDMVRLVRDTQASETLPVLVHCSAGCGRTGTICAIDFVWGLLRAGKLTEEFSLFNLVRDMRKQRVAMVQTKEQYILVHQAVRELFKEQLRMIESHPYENIDVNGVPLIADLEEPLYDTIASCKYDCDEKQDNSEAEKKESEKKEEKLDSAPPLPRKKRPNIPCSKQEKEVENLTQKNRSSVDRIEKEKEKELYDVSLSNSLLSRPRIAKLKALFERSPASRERNTKYSKSPTVSRSQSLGAIRKPIFSTESSENSANVVAEKNRRPILDEGKLKIPKLLMSPATSTSRTVPFIKRSKSLKIVTHQPFATSGSSRALVVTKFSKGSINLVDEAGTLRRRSLESLVGNDNISLSPWPESLGNSLENRLNSQLHSLAIDCQKNFIPGLGVRERRNSFRQAILKDDESDYESIWLPPKKWEKNANGELAAAERSRERDKISSHDSQKLVPEKKVQPNFKSAQTNILPDTKNLFLQRLSFEMKEGHYNKKKHKHPSTTTSTRFSNSDNAATESHNLLAMHDQEPHLSPRTNYTTSHDLFSKKNRQPQTDSKNCRRSYSEFNHSDQHSSKSDSPRSERVTSKEVRKTVSDQKPRHLRPEATCETSSFSSMQELTSVMSHHKSAEQIFNYGIVARVKLRPPRPNLTKDDFVLSEPVAPPRVRRHASVMVSTRHSMIDSTSPRFSTWSAPANKFVEGSGWQENLGVDLDAVAASIQYQKGGSSTCDSTQVNKNHGSSLLQQPVKKQQYL